MNKKCYDIICTYGKNITEVQWMSCDRKKREIFEKLYQQYRNDIYKISLYYTKNEQEAQDITQKVIFALYLRLDKIQTEYVKAYLITAARNLSYNWLRDTKKERESESVEALSDTCVLVESAEDTYLLDEDEIEKKAFLGELMQQLYIENEMWYHVLKSIYCLGMSHEDTAKLLGISKSVLYSKLYRAKKWIAKHYKEKYEEL